MGYHQSQARFLLLYPRLAPPLLLTTSASPHASLLCRRARRCPASSTDADVLVRPCDAFDPSTSSTVKNGHNDTDIDAGLV
jgi:hypothetical protein